MGYAAREVRRRWLARGVTEDARIHEVAEVPDTGVYEGDAELRSWAENDREIVDAWSWTIEEVLHEDGDRLLLRVHVGRRPQQRRVGGD